MLIACSFVNFTQVLSALRFCHQRGIYHCDVKLENILLLDDFLKVKLADFGLATMIKDKNAKGTLSVKGTTRYLPPERLQPESKAKCESQFPKAVLLELGDVWSLGVTLYFMLTGGYYLGKMSPRILWYSSEVCDLLRGMLHENPSLRLSMEGVWNHPWVQTQGREWVFFF